MQSMKEVEVDLYSEGKSAPAKIQLKHMQDMSIIMRSDNTYRGAEAKTIELPNGIFNPNGGSAHYRARQAGSDRVVYGVTAFNKGEGDIVLRLKDGNTVVMQCVVS